ncbi:metallophosphoesterase [Paracoccus yeei]|uniref:Metallophosphoesterase n=1 Tax=Paracoccus yeei TaxID=147645 RepID=A0A1V0GV84_9RHOB|nr:hypothetical protein [Paracoccus yeei]ARC37700.1 metallophosphoesterase [Paracoccus yeei]
MAHYLTADTHFADDPVRRFFARPFPSTAAMDAAMIARAAHITGNDDLWILGDFAACETEAGRAAACAAFSALPGRKHLIRGNHDPDWLASACPWASVHDLYELDTGRQRLVLCHYPLLTWNGVRTGTINAFGHVHTRWRGARGQVNVGVDQWSFRPVTPDEAEVAALSMPAPPVSNLVDGMAAEEDW